MGGFGLGLFVIGSVCIVVGVIFLYISLKTMHAVLRYKKRVKQQIKQLDKQVQNKYNKIISLSVTEFESYLTKVYAICMEQAAAEGSTDKDPNAAIKLHAKTLERVQVYLGDEICRAIDYFYGKDYLVRWCEMRFNFLNTRMQLPGIVSNRVRAEGIESTIR